MINKLQLDTLQRIDLRTALSADLKSMFLTAATTGKVSDWAGNMLEQLCLRHATNAAVHPEKNTPFDFYMVADNEILQGEQRFVGDSFFFGQQNARSKSGAAKAQCTAAKRKEVGVWLHSEIAWPYLYLYTVSAKTHARITADNPDQEKMTTTKFKKRWQAMIGNSVIEVNSATFRQNPPKETKLQEFFKERNWSIQ